VSGVGLVATFAGGKVMTAPMAIGGFWDGLQLQAAGRLNVEQRDPIGLTMRPSADLRLGRLGAVAMDEPHQFRA